MAGPYQCKDIEKALSEKIEDGGTDLTPYEARLYFAAFEYLWRAPFKGRMIDNILKAVDDLQDLAESLKRYG